MIDEVTPENVPAIPPPRLLRRLATYAKPYAAALALSFLLLAVMSGATNALPFLVGGAVDRWIVAADVPMDARLAGLWQAGLWFVGIAGAAFVVFSIQSLLNSWIGQRIVMDLRLEVFRKALRLPLAYFDRTPVGRLMTRVTSDVEAVQRFVTECVVGAVADVFMLIGVIVFMFLKNVPLAVTLVVILPVLYVILAFLNRRLRRAHRRIRERTSAMNALLQETFAGMTTIQLFNREARAEARFDDRNRGLRDAHFEDVRWVSLYFPSLEVIQNVSTALVIGVAGWSLLNPPSHITAGDLVAFLAYVPNFFRPLGALSDKAGVLQQAVVSGERLFALLDEPETIADPPRPATPPATRGRIEFDRVRFAYQGENWVLRDVSVDVKPGETVAIVGATGAGKSTVISLLARFYDVSDGAVRLDGEDVRNLRLSDLRRRIGLVLQEPFLFSGTVADNIALDRPDLPRERVVEAARYVNADRLIARLPQGYDTPLTERGGSLSAGEKQLIALARVFAQNPDVLLVFDEATANVDTETELLIQEATRRLMQGRTSIAIAHRLSTIRHADRILVMRHGRVTAQGTHRELMDHDPYYRHLYELLSKPDGI